jgi:hypothetical protein
MKKIIAISGCILLIFLLVHSKYLLTDGFTPRKITYMAPYNIQNEIESPLSAKCLYILDDEFSYLGRGAQTYVFESADKKYVIKFIRYHKYKVPFWNEILNYLNLSSKNVQKTVKAKINRYNLVMKSYKLSYSFLSDISLVEYVHLNQTDFFNKKIVVRDKCSKKHLIDLDKVAFVIQKKVSGLPEGINDKIRKNEEQGVCHIIDSFFDSLSFLAKNKIVNRDYPNIIRNSGVFDQKYVMTDVGSFFSVPTGKEDYLKNQYFNFSNAFKSFLQQTGPQYLPFSEERLQKEISCLSF